MNAIVNLSLVKGTNRYWCIVHQREFESKDLKVVDMLMPVGTRLACPMCLEKETAEFAVALSRKCVYCQEPSIKRCSGCGNYACQKDMEIGNKCVVCFASAHA